MGISKSDPVIIVGGGAFGLSTALHLSLRGYTNITVFEQDGQIPSRYSAANDLNKIMRVEYEDPFYTDLAVEAINAWKTPLFAPHFHQTGFLHCVSEKAPEKAVATLKRFQAAAERHSQMAKYVSSIQGQEDIRQLCWQLDGSLPGWNGYFNRYDGYVHSANALTAVYRATQGRGVRFFLGEGAGAVDKVVYENTPRGRKSNGIRTKAGRFHPASLVIVAAGAAATRLVPEIGTQVVAKSWSVAHVQLTDEETSALRGIPVTYARDLGFFFEPDPKTNLLKLCPMGGGYINTDPSTGLSCPPQSLAERGFLPHEDEIRLRQLLRQSLPALSDRALVKKSLCWFADTSDSDFIVDYVPQTSSSVILLSGDSGHGFKMFPIVGRWIGELLESPNDQQQIPRWSWKAPKPETKSSNWGGDVSWRLGETRELAEVQRSRTSKL
ncbi:FAD dependent oxidoreductase [Zopfia rhizophila CBS 207.26]|uniref:FAD dependent oxidoreductase n=1 Tax=Zopfia rhizophila CBS 207.26 TaxID=1314779 RepID=A0A6A6ESG6_9PEZI|nr:FAD dependent oxidoreductase [Zopfia rhizophila CBS 207.26]